MTFLKKKALVKTTSHRVVISDKPWPSLEEWVGMFQDLDPRIPRTAQVRYDHRGWIIEWSSSEVMP